MVIQLCLLSKNKENVCSMLHDSGVDVAVIIKML